MGEQWGMPPSSQAAASPALQAPARDRRRLTEQDAIDIWIARWLRVRRRDLVARYGCDPRRLYEIWEETRFAGSRAKARELFSLRHPGLADRIDWGPHRRMPRAVPRDLQPDLFEARDRVESPGAQKKRHPG